MVTEDDGYRVTGSDLHVATPDGAVRFVLATTPDVHELYPAWTPDGRALLYDDARTQRVMRLPLAEAR
jgi:sugar lactone lactonase YvrE